MASGEAVVLHDGGSMPQTQGEHGVAQSDAGGTEMARTAELGTSALEAQARAMVQARFFVARQPGMMRNWDQVEQRLRRECARPGFANSAWWVLPIGGDPKKFPAGLSIRFAEAALRMAGNIDVEQMVVSDDKWKQTVRVRVMDLETNFAYTAELVIEKTVERNDPKGREVLSYRQNSNGKMTYVVAATEQELAMKRGSAVSKSIRTNGLRLIPGDILDEAKNIILATKAKGAAAEDPETARKTILDSFASMDVMPVDIAKLVEHDTAHFTAADRELLRGVYTAIKNGVATWKEILEAKFGPAEGVKESPGAEKVKTILEKRGTTGQQPKTEPQPTQSQPATASQPTDPSPTTGKPATEAPSASQQATNQPKTDAPTGKSDQPPASLQDLAEFPDGATPTWVKVKGVVYRFDEENGNYRAWVPEPKKGRRERGQLDFGGEAKE